MSDAVDFGVEALPGLLGIIAAFYAAVLIRRRREDFFRFVRSWVVVLFIASLAVLWVVELMMYFGPAISEDSHSMVDATFVIVTSCLAVWVVLLSTSHSKLNNPGQFGAWMKRKPLNAFTGWGLAGMVIIVLTWANAWSAASLLEADLWLLALIMGYMLAAVGIGVVLSTGYTSRGRMPSLTRENRVSIVLFSVAWVLTPSTEFSFDLMLGDALGWEDFNPHNWILLLLLAILMRAVFVTQYMAIIVDAEAETVKRGGFRSFDIPRGVYLIFDEKSDSAFGLFSELVTMPLRPDVKIPGKEESASATLEFLIPRGLVITREFPDSVRTKHNLQVTPMIWLTESPGEKRIAPTSLAVLTDTIIRFMEATPNSIVLIEGMEYIMTFNEFKKVLRSLDSLNETAWITKARLLIAVNPTAFDEKDLALLERDRRVIKGRAAIEELKRESRVEGGVAL